MFNFCFSQLPSFYFGQMQDQPYDAENDVDQDDEKPTVVVLEPGDLSAEDVKKIEEKCKNLIKYP